MRLGLCSVLFVVFLVLKLTGLIAWSWWWVTSPLWISFILFGLVFYVLASIIYLKEKSQIVNKRK